MEPKPTCSSTAGRSVRRQLRPRPRRQELQPAPGKWIPWPVHVTSIETTMRMFSLIMCWTMEDFVCWQGGVGGPRRWRGENGQRQRNCLGRIGFGQLAWSLRGSSLGSAPSYRKLQLRILGGVLFVIVIVGVLLLSIAIEKAFSIFFIFLFFLK